MATTTKAEKPPVDHSGISGPKKAEEKPKSDFLATMQAVSADPTLANKPAGLIGQVTKGREFKPPRILLAGTEGIGKSTFAANAPKPIFIQTEDGLGQIECDKFPLAKTYQAVHAQLTAVAIEPHDYNTVAIDSVDWMERLIWDQVCAREGKKNIEDIGYAKGYTFALIYWREVLELLERCHARGMAVILIAHTKIEKFEDPENPTYDRYSPRLHKHAQALLTEWVDAVLFATRKTTIKREDSKDPNSRAMAISVGANGTERILRTTGSAACVAKNRYNLPAEIPLSWDAFNEGLSTFMTGPSKNVA
jgi:hypothetical protein